MSTVKQALSASSSYMSLRSMVVAIVLAISATAGLSTEGFSQRKQCVGCHKEFKQHLKRKHVHEPAKESCETCHKRHGFAQKLVLVKVPPQLCTDCHENISDELAGDNVHKALSQGGCTVCHDPHASDEPALMRSVEGGISACVLCHTDLSGQLTSGDSHEPFRKGDCASCHEAHASDKASLLVDDEAAVCANCHEGAVEKHEMPDLGRVNCSDCHDPHGATTESPVAPYVHEPFGAGECETCHDLDNGSVSLAGDFPPDDLCADCHDDEANAIAGSESHFGVAEMKSRGTSTCLECHNPHSSRAIPLLANAQEELCRNCHEKLPDKESFRGSSMHAPFVDGECASCHDPHGGGGEHHFNADTQALCSKCHADKTTPLQEGELRHEALGTMECTECHTGHAANAPHLLGEEPRDICKSCHDLEKHAEIHSPYEISPCTVCHENHSTRPGLMPDSPKDMCLRCHQQKATDLTATFSHVPAKEGSCTQCHEPHGGDQPGLLLKPEVGLCTSCHELDDLVTAKKGVPTAARSGSPFLHRPVEEGTCSECHDPHGSAISGLLVREGDKLCFGCHANERALFSRGNAHEPVAQGECAGCHVPHGTDGGDLVRALEPGLCTQCHDFSQPPLLGSHKGFDVINARCTACHDPHVSPVSHLLRPFAHEPFAEGDCESCHAGAAEGATSAMLAVSPDVCLDCHDEKSDDKGHQHIEGLTCTECHTPHASSFEGLLGEAPVKLCLKCHEDIVATGSGGDGQVHLHKPIETESCLECHQMHTAPATSFLAKPKLELCSDCHESIQQRAAHETKHQPFAQGQCNACHAAHAAAEEHLLKEEERMLCKSCHELTTEWMQSAHRSIPLAGEACASCHDPHSTLKASTALVHPRLHPPYEEGECSACHGGEGQPLDTTAACLECHDSDTKFGTVHRGGRPSADAGKIDVCLDCHSPHAGYGSLFARSDEVQTCMQCHDRKEFTRRVVHGALDSGCTTCHDLHSSNFATLKSGNVEVLCYDCHEASAHAHPVGSDYIDPRTGGALNCKSCHEPHSSDYDHLTQFDYERDLCVQCHAGGTMRAK